MTRFQRINLWLGLAALSLVAVMAASQTHGGHVTGFGERPSLQAFQ